MPVICRRCRNWQIPLPVGSEQQPRGTFLSAGISAVYALQNMTRILPPVTVVESRPTPGLISLPASKNPRGEKLLCPFYR